MRNQHRRRRVKKHRKLFQSCYLLLRSWRYKTSKFDSRTAANYCIKIDEWSKKILTRVPASKKGALNFIRSKEHFLRIYRSCRNCNTALSNICILVEDYGCLANLYISSRLLWVTQVRYSYRRAFPDLVHRCSRNFFLFLQFAHQPPRAPRICEFSISDHCSTPIAVQKQQDTWHWATEHVSQKVHLPQGLRPPHLARGSKSEKQSYRAGVVEEQFGNG